jgi:hypothetical protein
LSGARLQLSSGWAQSNDGNWAVLGQISAGFGSCKFGFRDDFSPTVFGFGFKFGFPLVDIRNKLYRIKTHVLQYANNNLFT